MNKKRILPVLLLVFMFLAILPSVTSAAPITSLPKTSIISDGGVSIHPKYTFVPKVTDKTKLILAPGYSWKSVPYHQDKEIVGWNRQFKLVDLANLNPSSHRGKIWAKYTNVGNYNGKEVDLKITINDWKRHNNYWSGGSNAFSFQVKDIAISSQQNTWTDMTWQYLDNKTGKPINTSGYFTYADIDMKQSVQMSKSMYNSIDRFLLTNRNNKLNYSTPGGEYKIYYDKEVDVDDNKYVHEHAFTFLYDNESSFRFKWVRDFGNRYLASVPTRAIGQYFFYVTNKPTRTTISDPIKKVDITDNLKLNGNVKYTIEHDVPKEPSNYFYSNYMLEDTVDKVLKSPSIVIKNQVGDNVTKLFDVSISGNRVRASAKSSTLKSDAFYGEKYIMEINAKLDNDKLKSSIGGSSYYTAKNKAFIKINNKNYYSNEVQTKIRKRTLTINHKDVSSGKTLKSTSKTMIDGESYSEKHISGLKSGEKAYRPTDSKTQSGTINGKNVTLNFYYALPNDIYVRHIDKDSKKVIEEGLLAYRYDGESYSVTPKTDLKNDKGVLYKPVDPAKKTYTMGSKNMTIDVYYTLPRNITVKHIDKDTNKLIKEETMESKYDGETYSAKARNDLKRSDGYNYKPLAPTTSSGKISGEDIVAEFFYTVPKMEISLDKIKIYTDRVSSEDKTGLPVVTHSKLDFKSGSKIEDFTGSEFELKVYDKTNKKDVYSKVIKTDSLENEFKIATKDLNKGQKIDYKFNLSVKNNGDKNYEFIVKNGELETYGFTSSEKIITASDEVKKPSEVGGHVYLSDYEGAVMTEKDFDKDVKEYKESINIERYLVEKVKSGYGYSYSVFVSYKNDLLNEVKTKVDVKTDSKAFTAIDSRMLDLSDELEAEYKVSDNKATIPMSVRDSNNDSKGSFYFYGVPRVYMDKTTGKIYKNKEKESYVDTNNSFLVPVWIESLGDYDISYKSKDKLGSNRIGFDIKDSINVYAYMFSHQDSGTPDDDEILLKPLSKDDNIGF